MRAILAIGLVALTITSCRRNEPPPPPPAEVEVPDLFVQMAQRPEESDARRSGNEDPVTKYDDAEYHMDSVAEAKLPESAARTHIGLFLAWVITRNLDAGPDFAGAPATVAANQHAEAAQRDAVRRRAMKGTELLRRWYSDQLSSNELTPEGAAFANDYFKKHFFTDYNRALTKGLPSEYAVPDTWESFDKLAPVIDRRFAAWKAKAGRRKASSQR